MVVERLKWLFSPLIVLLLLASCKPDDKAGQQNPVMQRHIEDYESTGDKWGFIESSGSIAIKAQFDDVRAFHDGLAPANEHGIWGYIDQRGQWVMKPSFIKAQPFENGVARVRFSNGLTGLINTKGDTLVPPIYEELFIRQGDFIVTIKEERKGLIKTDGRIILENQYDDVKIVLEQLIAIKNRNEYEIINEQQEKLLDKVLTIKKGGLLKTTTGWGKINDVGSWMIQPQEESIKLGHPDHVVVERDNNSVIMNVMNQKITAVNAQRLKYLGENRYASFQTGGWQLLDEHGQLLHEGMFNSIYKFSEGIAAYEVDEWWGYLDLDGQIITDPFFALPWTCSEGKIRLFAPSGFGFHDRNGRVVIEPNLTDVRDFSEGMAAYME